MATPARGRMPAAAAALALGAGIFLGRCSPISAVPFRAICVASGVVAAAAAVNLVVGDGRARRRLLTTDALLLAAVVLSGTAYYRARHELRPSTDVSLSAPRESASLELRISEVRATSGGRHRAIGTVSTRGRGPVAAWPGPAGDGPCLTGGVWVFLPHDVRTPQRGEIALVSGCLETPHAPRNPGSFDFRSYIAHRGIHSLLYAEEVREVGPPSGISSAALWVRRKIADRIDGERGDLLTALMLGDSSLLSDELRGSFRRSGTVHVLAVSGLHVGFIALMAHALLRSLRVPPRASKLLVIPCLAAFAALVGARPSVIRASVMASFVIAAWSTERRPHPLNTIGAAALAILLTRPGSLFDAGFGLSFGATLGIVLLFPTLRGGLAALERFRWGGRFIADSLALSLSAQLGVAPVAVAAFGELSLAAPLSNLVAVPLAAFSVAAGAAMIATSSLPSLSSILAGAAWASLSGLAAVAEAADGPLAALRVGTRFWPVPLLLAAGPALCGLRGGRPGRRTRAAIALSVGAAVGLALALWLWGPGRSRPRIVMLDVGQGDAILLEMPRGVDVLIDAGISWGGESGSDAGERVILPYLRSRGVCELDALVVTHGHRDHYGGAVSVMEECYPRVLVLPTGYESSSGLRETAEAAERLNIPIAAVAEGDTLVSAGSCRLIVLSPPTRPRRNGESENDRSVIVRAELGFAVALLTGDAESAAEVALLDSPRVLRSDILKIGHHGSSSSSTPEFLRAVAPSVAVVSVGEGNRYGHPDSAVLERLRRFGSTVFRTDQDGAVLIDVHKDRAVARGYASDARKTLIYASPQGHSGPTTTVE